MKPEVCAICGELITGPVTCIAFLTGRSVDTLCDACSSQRLFKAPQAGSTPQTPPAPQPRARGFRRLWQRIRGRAWMARRGPKAPREPSLWEMELQWRLELAKAEARQQKRDAERACVLVLVQREPAFPQSLLQPAGPTQRLVTITPEDFAAHTCFVATPVVSARLSSASSPCPTIAGTPQPTGPTPDGGRPQSASPGESCAAQSAEPGSPVNGEGRAS